MSTEHTSRILRMPNPDCEDDLESCLHLYIPGPQGDRILYLFQRAEAPNATEVGLFVTVLYDASERAKELGHQSAEGILGEAARVLEFTPWAFPNIPARKPTRHRSAFNCGIQVD